MKKKSFFAKNEKFFFHFFIFSENAQFRFDLGILKQMKEEFESNLAKMQEEEKTAQTDFADLKTAKSAEIAGNKKMTKVRRTQRKPATSALFVNFFCQISARSSQIFASKIAFFKIKFSKIYRFYKIL